MRQIIIKYEGTCKRCNKPLIVGQEAMYEKSMGCFCIGCEPKDTEEIRGFRLIKAGKKAERLTGRASRIDREAEAKMSTFNHLRKDYAWLTQPGYIPGRQRALKNYDKGMELKQEAENLRKRAENIIDVRVKGDAQRRDDLQRQELDKILSVGSKIYYRLFSQEGTILKVFPKSYRVKFDSGLQCAVPKIFCEPLKDSLTSEN